MELYRYEIKNVSLEQEDLLHKEAVFHTANGYIGVRGWAFEKPRLSD